MDTKPCFLVNNLTDIWDQCDFLEQNDCLEKDSVIDYVKLMYCDIGNGYQIEGIILLVIILIILFIGLGAAANEFLCPSLLALAKILGMSDSVAGVTLLAFGNGCPDIFSSLAAASDDRPELIIGELLGAGIFCTSIVSGLIFISSDFALACRPMLRDTIFYLLSAYLLWLFCWYGEITFLYAVSFIIIYIVYLMVALFGQAIYRRQRIQQEKIANSRRLDNYNNNNSNSICGKDNEAFTDDFNNYDYNNIVSNKTVLDKQHQQVNGAPCAKTAVDSKIFGANTNHNNNTDININNDLEQQREETNNKNLFSVTKSPHNTIMSQFKLSSLVEEYNDNANVKLKRYTTLQEKRRLSAQRRHSHSLHNHLENSLMAMTDLSSNHSEYDDEDFLTTINRHSDRKLYRETSNSDMTTATISSTCRGADEKVSISIKWIDLNNSEQSTTKTNVSLSCKDSTNDNRQQSLDDGKISHRKKYDNYGSIPINSEDSASAINASSCDSSIQGSSAAKSVIKVCGPSTIVLSTNNRQHQQRRASRSSMDKKLNALQFNTVELESKLSATELASQTDLNEWDDFLLHVCPIDITNWNDVTLFNKVFELARAPIFFIMLITIPVLDYESKRHNWCRILNAIHCITVPIAITMLTQTAQVETYIFGLPLYSVTILPGFILAFILLKTSTFLTPPKYHQIFAYIGFLMSIIWIYCLANEVINLLKTIGIIFSLSDAAIGLGILAWGNSLGDIVANLTLARSGYPRMAIGACIGAPLLNLLLGFGLSFSISLGPSGTSNVEYTTMTTLLYATITTVLISLMFSTLIPSNISKKYYGYTLILMYLVYFIMAICIEYGLLFK